MFPYNKDMDPAQSSKLISNCPLCHAEYKNEHIQLVGQHGTSRLFHCTCNDCGNAMLAIILESNGGISSVGLMTDLEAQDAIRMQNADPVSADDCIQVHQLLKKDSKQFVETIQKKAGTHF